MKRTFRKLIGSLLLFSFIIAILPILGWAETQPIKPKPAFPNYKISDRQIEVKTDKISLPKKNNEPVKQEGKLNPVKISAIPTYQIDITQKDVTRDDLVWISIEFDKIQDYSWINVTLENSTNENIYEVQLDRITDYLFEGWMYISYFTEPGSYTLSELSFNRYDSSLVIDLQTENFLNVTGTIGDDYPDLVIDFDKYEYTGGDTVGITVSADYGLEDFDQAELYFDGYPSVNLTKQNDGSFKGELYIDEYFPEGAVSVTEVVFSNIGNSYGFESFYSTEFYEGYTTNYQDFYDDYFIVLGTLIDDDYPEFQDISVSTTSIPRNGTVDFTVKASDMTSGVKSVSISLSDDYITLKKGTDGNWTGSYQPNPFYSSASSVEVELVYIEDHARNTTYADSGIDFSPINIDITGYELVGEIHGLDRYKTAAQISQLFPPSNIVILAKGLDFPDALAAGPLSYTLNAPILLTKTDSISDATLNEIKQRGATEVIVMGGTTAISETVVNTLKANGVKTVRRIAGDNRYTTALEVASVLGEYVNEGWIDRVVITNGLNFPDALAAGSWASWRQIPILLNGASTLRPEVKEYLLTNNIKYVSIIGGTTVLSDELIEEIKLLGINVARTSGLDRYNTSVAIANKFFKGVDRAFVTNGANYADALAAAPLAAYWYAPLILVNSQVLPAGINTYLSDSNLSNIKFVTVIGGDMAVSDHVKRTINDILKLKD